MTITTSTWPGYFLGEVVEVTATGANLDLRKRSPGAGDIDAAVRRAAWRTGARCVSITNSRRCAFGYDQRLEAFGERGMLTAANQLPTSVRFF